MEETPPHAPPRAPRVPSVGPGARRRPWLGDGAVWVAALAIVAAALLAPLQLASSGPISAATGGESQGQQVLPNLGPNIVGLSPYDGPATAPDIRSACSADGVNDYQCINSHLEGLLHGRGAEVAFQVLDDLTVLDADILLHGHTLAHILGRVALQGYGDPTVALQHCPYVLSAGCFHGVQQSYFEQIKTIEPFVIQRLCQSDDHSWQFQCLHGLGHGLMLYHNYGMNATFGHCDFLATEWERGSCYGGAFMENLVGWHESLMPDLVGAHAHGGPERPPPQYMIRLGEPAFPCNVLAERYLGSCFFIQASVALRVTGEDHAATAAMCRSAPARYVELCFMSYGRDTATNTGRNPVRASSQCLALQGQEPLACVRGYVMDTINERSEPASAIAHCNGFDPSLQAACFGEIGSFGKEIVGVDAMAAVCAATPEPYARECRVGAGIA